MPITWDNDCTDGTVGENMICEVQQQATEEIYVQNETVITALAGIRTDTQANGTILSTEFAKIDTNSGTIIDFQNSISAYLFFILIFATVYIILRWIFRLLSDVALGWQYNFMKTDFYKLNFFGEKFSIDDGKKVIVEMKCDCLEQAQEFATSYFKELAIFNPDYPIRFLDIKSKKVFRILN